MMLRAAAALLLFAVTGDIVFIEHGRRAAWCSGYLDVIVAGVAFDSAASGSQEQATAAMDLEAAFQVIVTTPIPDAIEPDWEVVKRGYDVSDAGESLSEAAIRIGEWTVASCVYSPEVVELLESDSS